MAQENIKYLVLRRFRSYGVTYVKGDIVDEVDIRSPRLRQSEGKIVPVVSSNEVPVEMVQETNTVSTVTSEELDIEEKIEEQEDQEKPVKLTFGSFK